jgi:hypothetical protein
MDLTVLAVPDCPSVMLGPVLIAGTLPAWSPDRSSG